MKEKIIASKKDRTITMPVIQLSRKAERAIFRYTYEYDTDSEWQFDGLGATSVETVEEALEHYKGEGDNKAVEELQAVIDACEELDIDAFAVDFGNIN